MPSYDRAITIFSPDGHLFQVEYAQEAVEKGATAVAVRGENVVVLGVEKKATQKLQEDRTVRKICSIDSHVALAFAGLTADARVMIDRARTECQQHRLTVEDAVTVEYITRSLANLKQRYTQSNGRRPFGLSALIVGFDPHTNEARLFTTDPAGTYSEWKANAIGRSSKTVREFLEKNYKTENQSTDDGCLKLACQALLEVVQSSSKNIELAIMKSNSSLEIVPLEKVTKLVEEIEKEKAAEAEKKKQQRAASKAARE
jgi:20S proteasome subunit alpha 4